MIIYVIVKWFLSYYLVVIKRWIKNIKQVNMILDVLLVSIFIYLVYKSEIKIEETKGLLVIGITIIIIFLSYRMVNEINKRFDKITGWIEKKERIKKILLEPKINKCIYYSVWMLPWNIVYWVGFWMMENVWYWRVFINSNRDIFFWRYFKWDSRKYFYEIFEGIEKKKEEWGIKKVKEYVYNVGYRVLIIIYVIRRRILEIRIMEYVWIRVIIYMYLSIFYLYFIIYFHVINYYLLLGFLCLEVILMIFMKEIIEVIMEKYKEEIFIMAKEGIMKEEFIIIVNLLKEPMSVDLRMRFEVNVFIWDKTLSNSVTLNILYKYMIWVNKNTEGYYDRMMNIRSRIHRKKMLEENSIIWDVLPRTRYVLYSLRNWGYKEDKHMYGLIDIGEEYKFINLRRNKNFYLSYYEKAYSKTSLLLFFWCLRMDIVYWNQWEINKNILFKTPEYKEFLNLKLNVEKHYFNHFILYYYYFDKNRFFGKEGEMNNHIIFNVLLGLNNWYAKEGLYSMYFKDIMIENREELKILEKFVGMRDYKMLVKIMGRIQLYEEEAMVWNEKLQKVLKEREIIIQKEVERMEKEKDLEKLMIFSYYRYFFTDTLDFMPNPKKIISRALMYSKALQGKIKTKIELEEVLLCHYVKGNLEELDHLEEMNITREKLIEILKEDMIVWVFWYEIFKEGLENGESMVITLYVHRIRYYDRYNELIYGKDYELEQKKIFDKYNIKF